MLGFIPIIKKYVLSLTVYKYFSNLSNIHVFIGTFGCYDLIRLFTHREYGPKCIPLYQTSSILLKNSLCGEYLFNIMGEITTVLSAFVEATNRT